MAFEDNDIQEQLQQAPPHAPTADDADANKAAADSAAAQSLVNAASGHTDSDLAGAIDTARPRGILPNKEDAVAPNIGQNAPPVAPGSFAEHLSNALVKAKSSLAPGAMAQPGAWSKLMVGATMDALSSPWQAATSGTDASRPTTPPSAGPGRAQRIINNLGASFGDVAAATEGGPEGGGIMGAARVARATSQRMSEEMKNRQLMATSNAQMLHEQALTHKLGEDAINASIESSKTQMENITTAVPGAPPDASGSVVAKDKTSDELNTMIQTGELKPTEQTVFATGRVLTGKDANGIPQYRTTYTVVKPAAEVDLTPENAKYLNDNLGTDYSTDKDKPQRLPGVQVNDLFQKANNARITKRAMEVKEAGEDETIRKAQTSKDAETIYRNPIVMKAIDGHKTSEDDPFAVVKAYDAIVNNPKLLNDPSMPKNFSEAYIQAAGGTAVWDKKVEEYNKAQQKNTDTIDDMLTKAEKNPTEIESHTPAFIAAMKSLIASPDDKVSQEKKKRAAAVLSVAQDVRQGEIDLEKAKAAGKTEAATGFQGDENATTPDAFLNSLKPDEQSLVKLIASGRAPLIRLEYLAARKPEILQAVERAYPGQFDASKVKSYMDTYKDFTSGKTSVMLNSGGTALMHLSELRGLNTVASHIIGTPAWNAYENKVDTLSTELAKFYGDATVPAIAAIKKTLMANLPGGRDAAITTQAKSMGDKLDSFENQWTNAAPSRTYQAPLPFISTAAKQARAKLDPDYAIAHPELARSAAQPGAPTQGHKVGDTIIQNGHSFKVTAVDAKGNVTGAE